MKSLRILTGILFAVAAYGQTGLATLTGTITDTSGAVVPNAPVELTNKETGRLFSAASSGTGNFTLAQLPVGDYDLSVAVMGFKTYKRTGFRLSAQQTLREDVALEVGAASESVTVSAEASLLRTESSELVHNVTLSQMNNLPILTVGVTNQGFRDPFSATRLVPGIRYAQGGATNTMVVNGTPSNSVQARLDGATQNGTGGRTLGATGQTQPSVDAVQEVAILTSNFAPEFGTAGGAVINMVSKSGTNQYHGTVYDYTINEALNAHQPYTGLRNKVRQHDWGFTFGGPVRIPKLYNGTNKTFFFWSYEQYREKKIITTAATAVPTPAYRAGDFANLLNQENRNLTTAGGAYTDPLGRTIASGTIFDPATQRLVGTSQVRDPFPGNRIPVSLFDPIAVKVLALVPQPFGVNAAKGQAGSNYQAPYNQDRLSSIPSIKLDQTFGEKGRASFYFQQTRTKTPRTATGADPFPDLITGSVSSQAYAYTMRLNYDFTASPRLLVHFGLAWNDNDFRLASPIINYDASKELGLTGQTLARNFPIFVTSAGSAALGGMSQLGTTSQSLAFERRPAGNISASYVKGGHTYKVGGEFRLEKFPLYDLANTAGTYTFGSNWTQQTSLQGIAISQGFTGFQFASFLLGGMSGTTLAAPVAASTSKSQTSIYAQDNWKVTRKLTLDYGVRWDYGTYAAEQYGRFSSFSPHVPNPSASGRLGGRQYEAVCKCNFASNYPYAIGPRLGIAYQFDRKTVIRAGFGVVYNSTGTSAGGQVNTASAGAPAFGQRVGLLRNGIPAEVRAAWPTFEPNAGHPVGSVSTTPPFYLDPSAGRPARLLQWNISLQREIFRNLVLEASYVANRGVWWEANALVAVNAISERTLRGYGFNDFTSTTEAQLLTTNVGNLTAAQVATLASRGINGLPYPNFPSNQTVRQSLTPFPHYSGLMSPSGAPLGKSWYDSFQMTLNKHFSRGLSFNLNYNFAKTLELMSSPDIFNRKLGKNLGTFDLPHQMRFTAQYQIPSLRSAKLRVVSNKYASAVLSGWGVGWYLNYQSAGLVGRPTSNGTVPISQFLGRGPGTAQLKREADGSYMNPWSVDWVDYAGTRHTEPIDINCHCFDPTKTLVLNPAVWENVPNGQWAADMSSIRWFRGIRTPLENANFSRNFRIKERVSLNVRVEFNNVFNRLQLPATGLGNFAATPTKFGNDAGTGLPNKNTGLYSGGFGTIVPVAGTAGQRAGTFIARLTF